MKSLWNSIKQKKFTKDNFLILFLVGILLLVIAWPIEDKKKESQSNQWDNKDGTIGFTSPSNMDVASRDASIWNTSLLGTAEGKGSGTQISAGTQTGAVTQANAATQADAMLSYALRLENELEEILGTMDGVGKVKVMVTLESSGEAVVEKDQGMARSGVTEVDSAGGSRNTTDISSSEETIYQNNGNTPYVRKVLSPKVEGVAVSAQGGGNAKIVQNITEVIQALFGIEAHKIKIVKMISQ